MLNITTFLDANLRRLDKPVFLCPERDTSYTSKEKDAYMKELNEIRDYYSKAQPYLEHVRSLKPDEIKLWGPGLSMTYANLGLKDKANEVDALISAANNK